MKILTKYATKGCSRSKTFYREMSEKLRRVGKMTSQRETADLNFEFTANMADVHFERLQLNVSRVSYVWQEWFSGNLLIVYQSFVWSSIDRISDWQYFDRSAPLSLRCYGSRNCVEVLSNRVQVSSICTSLISRLLVRCDRVRVICAWG